MDNWEKKLIEDFPIMYGQSNLDITQSLMCFGFDGIPEQFEPNLRKLSEKIEAINNSLDVEARKKECDLGDDDVVYYQCVQCKEKYSSFRCYMNWYNEEIEEYIEEAEREFEEMFGETLMY